MAEDIAHLGVRKRRAPRASGTPAASVATLEMAYAGLLTACERAYANHGAIVRRVPRRLLHQHVRQGSPRPLLVPSEDEGQPARVRRGTLLCVGWVGPQCAPCGAGVVELRIAHEHVAKIATSPALGPWLESAILLAAAKLSLRYREGIDAEQLAVHLVGTGRNARLVLSAQSDAHHHRQAAGCASCPEAKLLSERARRFGEQRRAERALASGSRLLTVLDRAQMVG